MADANHSKGSSTAAWDSNSLGRALIEGLRKIPVHTLFAEFGELRVLRATLNAIGLPIAVLDSAARILIANTAWHHASGEDGILTAALAPEAGDRAAIELLPAEQAGQAKALAKGVAEVLSGQRAEFEFDYRLSGEHGPRHLLARVVACPGWESCRAVAYREDVTARAQAEQARDDARHMLDAVLDTAFEGITIASGPEGTIERVSRRAHELLGPALKGIEGHSLNDFHARLLQVQGNGSAASHLPAPPLVRAMRSGEVIREEEVFLPTPDGSQSTLLCSASPLRDRNQEIRGAVAAWRDVTEGRLLVEQLRQSQKMEAIGRLAGGVAHDFNNLLMVIQGYSQMMRRRVAADPYLRGAVEEIHNATQRAATLTRQLLAFSRKQVLQPKLLDLNAVLSDMEGMLRHTIGEDIELVSIHSPGLKPVKADPGQLEQVILNLALNSRDAMPAGGTLTLETAAVVVDEAMARNHRGLSPGRYSTLAVRDTGKGMDAKTKERVFEPFFTTKEPGKGNGLGLATVYGIVKQSGGYIAVESAPGQGATFSILLPEEGHMPAATTPHVPLLEPPRGNETILLVEDEEKVRGIVLEFLRQCGYTVLPARNGGEALDLAKQHASIDLLLTDVVMPGLSGRELAARLGKIRPRMRVVLMSGYPHGGRMGRRSDDPGMTLLHKPFSLEDLGRKLREALDGG